MITAQLKQQALDAMLDGGFTQAHALEILNGPGGQAFRARELRDEFAGKALAGVAANPASGCNSPRDLAHWAYQCADAMMKARDA